MIDIKKLNKADLSAYIASADYLQSEVVPISKHRAMSQIANPRAYENDILLLMAYENNVMLGYLGILPDDIYSENSHCIHCGWMSCLWVDPEHRGKSIARLLMNECFVSWDHRILLTEYTEAAGMLYSKSGLFTTLHHSTGRRWYVRSDLRTILPPKKDVFKKMHAALTLIDTIFNISLNIYAVLQKNSLKGYDIKFVQNISTDFVELIQKQHTNEFFRRNVNDLKWILQNPWIKEGDENDGDAKKYFFTSVQHRFVCKGVEIRNSLSAPMAFIIFTNRNGHLRLPYVYHNDDPEAIRLVCNHLISIYKIKTVTIYHEYLISYFDKNPFIQTFSKKVNRHYLASKTLSNQGLIKKGVIQDGDGDCAFT